MTIIYSVLKYCHSGGMWRTRMRRILRRMKPHPPMSVWPARRKRWRSCFRPLEARRARSVCNCKPWRSFDRHRRRVERLTGLGRPVGWSPEQSWSWSRFWPFLYSSGDSPDTKDWWSLLSAFSSNVPNGGVKTAPNTSAYGRSESLAVCGHRRGIFLWPQNNERQRLCFESPP